MEAGSGSEGEEAGSGDEAEEAEAEAAAAEEEEEEEESSEEEEDIDQTIYAPPKTALLPAEVPILEADEQHGLAELALPSAAVGELLAAYNAIRAFSWQLRVSPFSFPDFCAAMKSQQVGGQAEFWVFRWLGGWG